jgi:hypothetical protein
MKASLDTDVVIHLYRSGKKELLSMFDSLYIHEYLAEKELKRVSRITYDEVMLNSFNFSHRKTERFSGI